MKNNNTLRRVRLTPAQQIIAAERYASGETTLEIAKSFGVCSNAICTAIRKTGGQIRDRATRATKYAHHPHAFDVLTPEAAYWIGFLFADGSLPRHPRRKVLSVGLQAGDRGHLVKLQHFIGSTHPLYRTHSTIRGKTHEGVQLAITAPRIVDTLRALGMGYSLERVAPEMLVDSKHFWRGAVDGDGHVGLSQRTRESGNTHPTFFLDLCGGHTLTQQFLTFLRSHGIGHHSHITSEGLVFRVRLGAGTAVSAIRLLYFNETLFLDRKFQIARRILDKNEP